ncbi:Zn finger-containing GTPase- Activating Protein for ARF [Ascosphaera acerosa]|nr:Zn finger-containing GTPase- Activating Protein for ARF [Ascosphaera acerosa]
MGLLALGTPLPWPAAKRKADQVREWGIEQLLAIWRKTKGKQRDALLWGDEIEYLVILMDDDEQKARLSLHQAEILESIAQEEAAVQGKPVKGLTDELEAFPKFHPEFGRFMLEATPGKPWTLVWQQTDYRG